MELKDLDTTQDPTASGYRRRPRRARSWDGGPYVPHAQRYLWPVVVVYGKRSHGKRRARRYGHKKRY